MGEVIFFPCVPYESFTSFAASSVSFFPTAITLVYLGSTLIMYTVAFTDIIFPIPKNPWGVGRLDLSTLVTQWDGLSFPVVYFYPAASSDIAKHVLSTDKSSFSLFISLVWSGGSVFLSYFRSCVRVFGP